jgi:hypothetical protein
MPVSYRNQEDPKPLWLQSIPNAALKFDKGAGNSLVTVTK